MLMTRANVIALIGIGLSAQLACKTAAPADSSEVLLFGGEKAKDGDYPSTVGLMRVSEDFSTDRLNYQLGCTGSVISRTHVLTAAHCVVKVEIDLNGQPQIELRYDANELLTLKYGVDLQHTVSARIKQVHLIPGIMDYLQKHKNFIMEDARQMQDLAVIELSESLPQQIPVATISRSELKVKEAFKYGGYGCELRPKEESDNGAAVPSDDNRERVANQPPRLKYAPGNISLVNDIIAEGNTFDDVASVTKSGCYGDSGGPVYQSLNGRPQIIGVNSYGRTPKEVPGMPGVELGFVVVSGSSPGGKWVAQVLAGKAGAVAGTIPPRCIDSGLEYAKAMCGEMILSCALKNHSTLRGFPLRPVARRMCLATDANGKVIDPLGLLKPYQFLKIDPVLWQDSKGLHQVSAAKSEIATSSMCYEGEVSSQSVSELFSRLKIAVANIKSRKDEPMKFRLKFLNRTSEVPELLTAKFDQASDTIVVTYQQGSGPANLQSLIPRCDKNYGH